MIEITTGGWLREMESEIFHAILREGRRLGGENMNLVAAIG